MLIQLLVDQPRMIVPVLRHTPPWVWGLLAALVWLGLSQARARSVGLARVTLMPLAMTVLSIWSTASAFGKSSMFGYVMLAWMVAAAVALSLTAPVAPAPGTGYDPDTRRFNLPGSWVPMALMLGIFLTKYVVGVETSMQPALVRDGYYTLVVGALYGLFSGLFAGRAIQLWWLAYLRGGPRHAPAHA